MHGKVITATLSLALSSTLRFVSLPTSFLKRMQRRYSTDVNRNGGAGVGGTRSRAGSKSLVRLRDVTAAGSGPPRV